MNYQNHDYFYLSKELADAISYIISQKEGADYICQTFKTTISEHEGLVFSSPLDGYNPWGGGLNALSGAQIRAIDEKYGKWIPGTIPAEYYAYLVIADAASLQTLFSFSFQSNGEIERALEALSICHLKYDGIVLDCNGYDGLIFDSKFFGVQFPYLQDFFDRLNSWRVKNGRATIDDAILADSVNVALAGGRK